MKFVFSYLLNEVCIIRINVESILTKHLTRSIASTVRTIDPFVILSVAKNLVVAPARVCLIIPHKKCLAHHNTYSARFCLIWRKNNLGYFSIERQEFLVAYAVEYKNDFGYISNEV